MDEVGKVDSEVKLCIARFILLLFRTVLSLPHQWTDSGEGRDEKIRQRGAAIFIVIVTVNGPIAVREVMRRFDS